MSRIMRMRFSPTRMELLRLRKRWSLATRGHRLLKEKVEGLIRQFTPLVSQYVELRSRVILRLWNVLEGFSLASAVSSEEQITRALVECQGQASLTHAIREIMNVRIPVFSLEAFGLELSYSFVDTPVELDQAIVELQEVFPELLALAGLEETLRKLAKEIEKTRRRVNALEYVLIPQLEEGIRGITRKLDEMERGTRTQLMKIKDMLQER